MAPFVSDVTAQTFQRDVVDRSAAVPVLLDFWADWCGPCKTLGPVLEKLAAEYGGAFEVGKVDTEKEQELSYAFGVQGIPFCVLVKDGRPLDGFQGALPEEEVRKFLSKHGIAPDVGAEPAAAPPDPDSPAARLARAIQAAAGGDAAAARQELTDFPEDEDESDAAARLLSGLDWLDAQLAPEAGAAEAALVRARERFQARDYGAAMEAILDSVAADKGLRGGPARKAMLVCFAVVGEEDEQLDPFRRRLATLLY